MRSNLYIFFYKKMFGRVKVQYAEVVSVLAADERKCYNRSCFREGSCRAYGRRTRTSRDKLRSCRKLLRRQPRRPRINSVNLSRTPTGRSSSGGSFGKDFSINLEKK